MQVRGRAQTDYPLIRAAGLWLRQRRANFSMTRRLSRDACTGKATLRFPCVRDDRVELAAYPTASLETVLWMVEADPVLS